LRAGETILNGIAAAGDAGIVERGIKIGQQRQLEQRERRVLRGELQMGLGGQKIARREL
jgi:hypothetical protein